MQMFKIITLGSPKVGRTCLIQRFSKGVIQNYTNSVQSDFCLKKVLIGDTEVILMIWDTSIQDRINGVPNIYYKNLNACIIAFDITDRKSYEKVEFWMDELSKKTSDNLIRALVGCKADLEDQR